MEGTSPPCSGPQQPLLLLCPWDCGTASLCGPRDGSAVVCADRWRVISSSLCDLFEVKELCSCYLCICLKNEVLPKMNKL